jgi:hypothetical protein
VPVVRDLGRGLELCRIHALPEDLAAAALQPGPLVLDLRYVHGGVPEAAALDAFVRRRSSPRTPVFLLIRAPCL